MNTLHSTQPSDDPRKKPAAPESPSKGANPAATAPSNETGEAAVQEETQPATNNEASHKPGPKAPAAPGPAQEPEKAMPGGEASQPVKNQASGKSEESDKSNPPAQGEEKKKLPTLHRDVATLDPEFQAMVREMLSQGATFEDVVEAINETGEVRVTLQAIRNFFRRNFDVQRARVTHQIQKAEALLASIGRPESVEGQLARAAFLDGFLRLERASASVTPRDADLARARRAHLQLRKQYLVMRNRKTAVELELSALRKRNEEAKLKFVRLRMQNMRQEMAAACKTRRLSGDAVRQIQEIYGLLDEPLGVMPLEPAQMPKSPQEIELLTAEEAEKRLPAGHDVKALVEAFRDDNEQE